jgi:uncharacterized NAD-dependent epimerase/dehydratase family protein
LDWNGLPVRSAVVLARGQFRSGHAKTAHGLILHGRRVRIVAVIDETCAGKDAGELMGIGRKGIPVVADLSSVPGIPTVIPDTLIIGVAPTGGHLPPAWRKDVREAIRRGMDIVSGLHDFIGDDPELARLAKRMGVGIWDVRRPPRKLVLLRGIPSPVPVVLTCGTDASVGKRTVTAELHRAARARGIDAALVATGQTGVMIGADAGAVIDHIPGDFMSGTVEDMVQRMVKRGKELIFVQGQASLTHLAYGAVTLGILFGARPHFVVMVHVPGRRHRPSFPDQPVKGPMEEFKLVHRLSCAEAVGIALNCRQCRDPASVCRAYQRSSGLPSVDVLNDGAGKILDALLLRLRDDRRFRLRPGVKRAILELEKNKGGRRG